MKTAKKFLAIFLAMIFVFGQLGAMPPITTYASEQPPGAGTALNPWQISTPEHLLWMNEGGTARMGQQFILMNNIVAPDNFMIGDFGGFPPANLTPFTGVFDGNGHIITVNIIHTGVQVIGLFRSISDNGVVRNLGVAGSVTGGHHTGGLVGITSDNALIETSFSSVNVTANGSAGGFIGTMSTFHAMMRNVYATGNVSSTDTAGGLVGTAHSAVENSFSAGNISSTTTHAVASAGGIAGSMLLFEGISEGIINSVSLNGSITSVAPGRAGRIFGATNTVGTPATPRNTFARDNVLVNNAPVTGGLHNNRDGANATPAQIATQAWWENSRENWTGWDFVNVWRWCYVNSRPTLRIFADAVVTFDGVTANGVSNEATTTELTLNFGGILPDFPADNITVTGAGGTNVNVTGISGTGNTRVVTIAGTWDNAANVTVSVGNIDGIVFNGNPQTVALHRSNLPYLMIDGQGQYTTRAAFQPALQAALNTAPAGATVEVTGSLPNAIGQLDITIPENITVLWNADYRKQVGNFTSLMRLHGAGTFIVGPTGRLHYENGGNNDVVSVRDTVSLKINGGTVEHGGVSNPGVSNAAITVSGDNNILTIESGIVRAYDTAAIWAASGFLPPNLITVNINGGTVENSGTSTGNRTIEAIDAYFVINGGTIRNNVNPAYTMRINNFSFLLLTDTGASAFGTDGRIISNWSPRAYFIGDHAALFDTGFILGTNLFRLDAPTVSQTDTTIPVPSASATLVNTLGIPTGGLTANNVPVGGTYTANAAEGVVTFGGTFYADDLTLTVSGATLADGR
ncbi:MAG: hypothetical protein FWF77_05445, partial [Defluviitaleaceae bacterium]|nr:hypothetical protein [Defluviitaleaceae bacterium]